MNRRQSGVVIAGMLAIILVSNHVAHAQAVGAGCHPATAQEKAEMVRRGLPAKFEVCPGDAAILGIGQDFEQWYARLRTVSPCNRNTCTLSCRTRNTGAQVCGPTSKRWNAIGCHPNNNTAIFPTVSHGFAAHIELLRRYCGERGRCTINSVIGQWTGTAGDRPSYANFVSRNSGMPANQVFDPNDVDLMGRIALAMSCFEAGSMPYSVSDLKQGLSMAAGGKRVPVPANVGQLLQESLQGSYTANPSYSPNSHPNSWSYPQSSVQGNGYSPPTPPASPLPITGQQTSGRTDPVVPGKATTTMTTTSVPAKAQGAVTIVAQPSFVKRGGSITVSWSSVGMRPSCAVTSGAAQLALANEGSKIVPTNPSTPLGSMVFTVRCTRQTGGAVVRSVAVTIQ